MRWLWYVGALIVCSARWCCEGGRIYSVNGIPMKSAEVVDSWTESDSQKENVVWSILDFVRQGGVLKPGTEVPLLKEEPLQGSRGVQGAWTPYVEDEGRHGSQLPSDWLRRASKDVTSVGAWPSPPQERRYPHLLLLLGLQPNDVIKLTTDEAINLKTDDVISAVLPESLNKQYTSNPSSQLEYLLQAQSNSKSEVISQRYPDNLTPLSPSSHRGHRTTSRFTPPAVADTGSEAEALPPNDQSTEETFDLQSMGADVGVVWLFDNEVSFKKPRKEQRLTQRSQKDAQTDRHFPRSRRVEPSNKRIRVHQCYFNPISCF